MEVSAPVPKEAQSAAPKIALGVLALAALALFAIGVVFFFFGDAFGAFVNSDAAVAALIADEMLRQHSLLPATWYYGNGEIWTFGPQMFVLPFVAMLGPSMLALKLGNVLALCAIAGLVALPVRRVSRSWAFAVIVSLGLLACYSPLQAQMIYGQTAYGWFTAQLALLVHLALRLQSDDPADASLLPKPLRTAAILYVIVMLNLGIGSPQRLAAYWMLPIVGVCAAFPLARRRANALIVLTLSTWLISELVHGFVVARLLVIPGVEQFALRAPSEWPTNLLALGRSLRQMAGCAPIADFASGAGVACALRVACLALAGIGAVLALPLGRFIDDPEARFFVHIAAAMLVVVVMIFALGSMMVSARYLLPAAILSVASIACALWRASSGRRMRAIAVVAAFVVAFSGSGAVFALDRGWHRAADGCEAAAQFCQLRATLEGRGLRKGYATFWNANAVTLASAGRVVVCGTNFAPRIRPFRWLVSSSCFDPPQDGRYFVVLSGVERRQIDRDALFADLGKPDEIVSDGEFEIMTFASANRSMAWLERQDPTRDAPFRTP